MNIIDSSALFVIMFTLAIIPSTSVALVVTRSVTFGIANGIAVAVGIVLGDLIFILLVLYGLSTVAETLGGLFYAIKVTGGIYLIWVGYGLLRSKVNFSIDEKPISKGNYLTSFFSGLLLTLGDIKAIFFYLSLFPAFVNLEALQSEDIVIICVITILTVGGTKLAYAFAAKKMVAISQGLKLEKIATVTAGGFLLGAGSYLIIKA